MLLTTDGDIIKRTEIMFHVDPMKLLGRRIGDKVYITERALHRASAEFLYLAQCRNIELKVVEWL